MCLGVAEERRKNDGEEGLTVVADEAHYVIVAPIVECSLGNL